jgi:type I restriction enzyme M protein
MNDKYKNLDKILKEAAEKLWGAAGLKPSERTMPVLGLIFLKFADVKFSDVSKEIAEKFSSGRRDPSPTDYQAHGALFIPDEARYSNLVQLSENKLMAEAIENAMELVEKNNDSIRGILPRDYKKIENKLLHTLVRLFNDLPDHIEGDYFGRVYEYFLGNFAMSEGQKGGEFFTPRSLVKLIVEIIEPYHGRILDPACGSGGMFVQSAKFVEKNKKDPSAELAVYGQEIVTQNVNIAKMNLAVNGLEGEIKQADSYKEDLFDSVGKFDFVMANPPFNGKGVDKDTIKDNPRFKLGMPSTDNANYLWIQMFYSALNNNGRAGFVMANSAGDAKNSEEEIRKKLIESGVVDVVVSISPNFFYTVVLPCTLWFFDKGKVSTNRKDKVLFVDARKFYTQIDRAHRDFSEDHIQFLSDIVRVYRGHESEYPGNSLFKEHFENNKYRDIKGICKLATLTEIKEQDYSLNPGRYVGITDNVTEDFDFLERFEELNEGLEVLNAEARVLEEEISMNAKKLLGLNGDKL